MRWGSLLVVVSAIAALELATASASVAIQPPPPGGCTPTAPAITFSESAIPFNGQPPPTTSKGTSFAAAVAIWDGCTLLNNTGGQVPLQITPGTGATVATLSCTANPGTFSAGIANFSCSIDTVGTGYTLTASYTITLPPLQAVSSSIDITSAANADLAISAGVSPPGVAATSAAGAPVSFTAPTATDEDGAVAVVCDHTSGATFPVGQTTVTCSATDGDDTNGSPAGTVSTTLTVTVTDTDLAIAAAPAIVVNATGSTGAAVTYAAPTATDEDGTVAVVCDHTSGATFPVGQTTVTCKATSADDSPSTASTSFTVTVKGALSQLTALLAWEISQGIPPRTGIIIKTGAALVFLVFGDVHDACVSLTGMIKQVSALSGKMITKIQAAYLIATAGRIRAVLPCPKGT